MTSLPKFINHRIEEFALQVTYSPEERTGTLVYNLSLIRSEDLEFAIKIFKDSYRAGGRGWPRSRSSSELLGQQLGGHVGLPVGGQLH